MIEENPKKEQNKEKNTEKDKIYHIPTLESTIMVEETIKQNSGKLTRYQLWKKLGRGTLKKEK